MSAKYTDADPRALRAIAHPVRGMLLYELFARGAATATTLGNAIGEPVNSVSFHLRQLAKYGLIEEAADLATDGRQRWWRPSATEGLHISADKLRQTPRGAAAFNVFRRHTVAYWTALIQRFFSPRHQTSEVWESNDVPMMLTDEEAREYADEIYAVMSRWHHHGLTTDPPPGLTRRTYLGMALVLPHQTDLIERSAHT